MKINSAIILTFILAMACGESDQNKGAIKSRRAQTVNHQDIYIDTSRIARFQMNCSIRAIYAVDKNTLWFAGTSGHYGYTEDAGKTWYLDSIQHELNDQLEFRSIAITESAVFLLSIGSPGIMYKSSDKGLSWNIVYFENDPLTFYDAMDFWDNDTGIAMGDPVSGCLSIIKTVDGGNTWNKISCDLLPKTKKGEAAFAASNSNIALYGDHVWMVSGGGSARVFHSPDRGVKWEVFDTPIVQGGKMTGIFSCDFFDDMHGIIWGGDWESQDQNLKNKAITNDGGRTWSLIADGMPPGYRSCVRYFNSPNHQDIIAVGIPGISLTKDGGQSWEEISNESFYTVRSADNVLWLGGKNKIARVPLEL